MRLNLSQLDQQLEMLAEKSDGVMDLEKAMWLISLVCYSPITNTHQIDYSSFTMDQARKAFDELSNYFPDDSGGDEDENKGNLLTELNRIAHLRQSVEKLRPPKSRKFF